jgi:hypothetical protein
MHNVVRRSAHACVRGVADHRKVRHEKQKDKLDPATMVPAVRAEEIDVSRRKWSPSCVKVRESRGARPRFASGIRQKPLCPPQPLCPMPYTRVRYGSACQDHVVTETRTLLATPDVQQDSGTRLLAF